MSDVPVTDMFRFDKATYGKLKALRKAAVEKVRNAYKEWDQAKNSALKDVYLAFGI